VRKALGLLGMGRDRVQVLPVDAQGRIRCDALPPLEAGAIVCAQAGNVNSGASDDFVALRAWCDGGAAWLHVDGAFGLFAAASPRLRAQVEGVERADSWATDGHKWLNVPYDCGAVFVRDPSALRGAMAMDASYLPTQPEREPFLHSPELSRRARGIEVWAALLNLGRAGVAELVERCCRHATRFAQGLREAGHEVLNEVALNQVVVAFGDDAQSARVIARIQEAGVCWAGPTQWHGRAAMRISVSGWSTTEADVERSLASMLRCAAEE
jgi:glutamate/tyrosine decarboxylase-like PLP-dependent enzyme